MNNILKNIKYTWKHKKYFIKVEKEILGYNTFRGYMHDVDKIFLYAIGIDRKVVQKIHRKRSRHHSNGKPKQFMDYMQMIIDWECARYTKPDKPLNAFETMEKFYPELEENILPLLKRYNLV